LSGVVSRNVLVKCLQATPSFSFPSFLKKRSASWRVAPDIEVGDADHMQAGGQARLRQEHGAELAAADQPQR
jgi:hypothetical protein